jgi:hypothetical protein
LIYLAKSGFDPMRQCDFVTLFGRTAMSRPLRLRAQQLTPVIGRLGIGSPEVDARQMKPFR